MRIRDNWMGETPPAQYLGARSLYNAASLYGWFKWRFVDRWTLRATFNELMADQWGKFAMMYLGSAMGANDDKLRISEKDPDWVLVLRASDKLLAGHLHVMELTKRLRGILRSSERSTAILSWYTEAVAEHCALRLMLLDAQTVAEEQARGAMHPCVVGCASLAAQILATFRPDYLRQCGGDVTTALGRVKAQNLAAHFEIGFARYAWAAAGGATHWMAAYERVVLARTECGYRAGLGLPVPFDPKRVDQEFRAITHEAAAAHLLTDKRP